MNIYEKSYPYETHKDDYLVMAIEGPLRQVYAVAEHWKDRFRQCGEEESSTPGHTILCYRILERDKFMIVEQFQTLAIAK